MNETEVMRGVIISNFNAVPLCNFLENSADKPSVTVEVPPYANVESVVFDAGHDLWKHAFHFGILWTQPEYSLPSFGKMLQGESISLNTIEREVDNYITLIQEFSHRARTLFIPSWHHDPSIIHQSALLDLRTETGITNTILRMNLRLAEGIERDVQNCYLLNSEKWFQCVGQEAYDSRLWYLAKVPFCAAVFKEAMVEIKNALNTLAGGSKKLILLDLDNTLWGGIVGDIGWEKVILGGHHAQGEAFFDFQKALKILTKKGIMLGIVSKNEEHIALQAIRENSAMALCIDDFVGWKINWGDKARNVVELSSELNIGLHSVVFIDDNPVERARVREALPEVVVPEWPADPLRYTTALRRLPYFDTPSITVEDGNRTKLYIAERTRHQLQQQVGSLEEWYKSLDMVARIEELNDGNFERALQLLNKTNQMNLRTRRMTREEFRSWIQEKSRIVWTVRVSDRFGDSGLVGLISLEIQGDRGDVRDFVLSCRVMGRKIEEALFFYLAEYGQIHGLRRICAQYLPTSKNIPCLRFLKTVGFQEDTDNTFTWIVNSPFSAPEYVTIKKT